MQNKYYDNLLKFVAEKKCKLITTLEQYNIKARFKKINIISSCGHPSSNIYENVFKNRDTGVICINCIHEKSKLNNKNNLDYNTMDTESDGIDIIEKAATKFIVKKTHEGCLSDLAIKPINITDDLWLPIQLKSSNSLYKGFYSFQLNKNYPRSTT